MRIEADGSLVDLGTSAPPISSSQPIDEAHRTQVLSLLALVGVCWESHPRAIPEP